MFSFEYRSVMNLRIKKISSDKVVVQLSDSDLEYFDLNLEKSVPQAADLHKLLFEIMEIVKNETGFDAYHGGQVVVEAAVAENGINFIITKIHTAKKSITKEEFAKVRGVRVRSKHNNQITHEDIAHIAGRLGTAKRNGRRKAENISYVFDNFGDFENAVCAASDTEFGGMSLYRKGRKYAIVSKNNLNIKDYNILSEYASHTIKNNIASYDIKEGWTPVAEADEFSRMAEEIRRMN